ncbi:hypothetical protein [Leptospira bouyouniensis]|uniref:Lipoprotein n=1 Tax=Leptospira bouyouniensis TaxID=2484911 RepID=A0ABY2L291_9LEPT|nr:hypothetical protein [Leptospira bouyouniensis]TGK48033.1 hypothetical protein EHQ10_09780 [Leptospira bouyouniensis]
MTKQLFIIIFFFFLIGCKKEESPLEGTKNNNGNVDYKSVEAQVTISEGSIVENKYIDFESLESSNPNKLLKEFNFWLDKKEDQYFSVKGINSSAIQREAFNEATIYFGFGFENEKLEYKTQTYSRFDTAGSNSKGTIEQVKCSSYTDTLIKCKFYFGTAEPANGMPTMSWVIVTIKDRALVNVEDDLGASFLGYIDTHKDFLDKRLSNLKKALKVAVKDPKIGLKDEQLRGFSIEELDLLTDGLASQVKAGK